VVVAFLLTSCTRGGGERPTLPEATQTSCLEGVLPSASSDDAALLYWAPGLGLHETPPADEPLPSGFTRVESMEGNFRLDSLRSRGGELFFPANGEGGQRCERFDLTPDVEDQGWMRWRYPRGRGDRRRELRYVFRQTMTAFVDRDDPSRSRTIEQLMLTLDSIREKQRGADGRWREVGGLACVDRFHVVGADDEGLILVRGHRLAAVRAYSASSAIQAFFLGQTCRRELAANEADSLASRLPSPL
jgi:hypothetical protein